MEKNNSKKKPVDSNNKKFNYNFFSRNSELENYHKNISVKNSILFNHYSNRDNNTTSFKYDKLYFYETEKKFSNELRKNKTKKIKINLKKISNFHKFCIHNKIKPNSESLDYKNFTLNNYNKNICNYNKNNLTIDKTNSIFSENDINAAYSQRSFLTERKIYNKKIKRRNSKDINIKNQILNYKFKNISSNPNDNIYTEGGLCPYRHQNNLFAEQIKTKLKLNIINKTQNDFFQIQNEKLNNPKSIFNYYEKFYAKNKTNFELFVNLVKKYFGYLYLNIEKEKHILQTLKEHKESLKEEIFQINKKINAKKDKINFFHNLIILLIKIKYNVDDIDKIPDEYLKKYGIFNISLNRNSKYGSKIYKKRNSMLITQLKDLPYMKYLRKSNPEIINQKNINTKRISRKKTVTMNLDDIKSRNISFKSKSPEKRRTGYDLKPNFPIFNSSNELDEKIKGIEYHLLQSFKLFSDKRYSIHKYKLELNESNLEFIKSNNNKKSVYSFIQLEKEEAKTLKQKYEDLSKLKNLLLYDSNKKNKKFIFQEKIIKYILEINKSINIEVLLKSNGIIKFLASQEEAKFIYNLKEYNKIIFCVKILESVFLYLMKERSLFLLNEKNKEKYLEFKEILDKNNRHEKLKEISNNANIQRYKKEKELLLKYNKLILLPIKKDDPFSSFMIKNRTIHLANKKRTKTETNNKIDLILENEILY